MQIGTAGAARILADDDIEADVGRFATGMLDRRIGGDAAKDQSVPAGPFEMMTKPAAAKPADVGVGEHDFARQGVHPGVELRSPCSFAQGTGGADSLEKRPIALGLRIAVAEGDPDVDKRDRGSPGCCEEHACSGQDGSAPFGLPSEAERQLAVLVQDVVLQVERDKRRPLHQA